MRRQQTLSKVMEMRGEVMPVLTVPTQEGQNPAFMVLGPPWRQGNRAWGWGFSQASQGSAWVWLLSVSSETLWKVSPASPAETG